VGLLGTEFSYKYILKVELREQAVKPFFFVKREKKCLLNRSKDAVQPE
jgi:hypothetical protein